MYADMKAYVRNFLKSGGDPLCTELDKELQFRDRYEHTLRVLCWAQRICDVEGGDREVVEIAAIFHDVAKWVKDKPHAEAGAEICRDYLRSINYNEQKTEKIVRAIKLHSSKDLPQYELSLEDKIIMDADLIDELGAMCVLWDSMDMGSGTEQSYSGAYYRILSHYIKRKEAVRNVKTDEGRRLYNERVDFLGRFLKNLKYELCI